MELKPLGPEAVWPASGPALNDDRGSFREWFKGSEITRTTGMDFAVAQANLLPYG